ncbi:hypothetical protein BCR41DRAFT_422335 [Lobosporangium transversale]|uniref:Uncharacterized protein n=1 Tax=Lobosporangium transversale TaxID=64571 RepID=A0A1Y2GMI8_9FUNG|nr:hypothetical protein BCR41DRAFT_422335 [Lobosporangium transversale]ORZ15578.1 hypothetical protein BCR41DRAFT_422335 [Lobosporangium transversale]|eukprot:XP_021881326.1 hypothetical protein BCR41DRAFT_422335 [Lobosporangium transversale]
MSAALHVESSELWCALGSRWQCLIVESSELWCALGSRWQCLIVESSELWSALGSRISNRRGVLSKRVIVLCHHQPLSKSMGDQFRESQGSPVNGKGEPW